MGKELGLGFDVGLLTEFPYGIRLGVTGRTLGTDMTGEHIDPEIRYRLYETEKRVGAVFRLT